NLDGSLEADVPMAWVRPGRPGARTVTLCGSMAFFAEMTGLAEVLRAGGLVVHLPESEGRAADWESAPAETLAPLKRGYMDLHLDKIRAADLVLVVNHDRHGVTGYVGANSLMEAAFAHALGKPVAYLFEPGP